MITEELQIGDWVRTKDGNYGQIRFLSEETRDHGNKDYYDENEIEPIPLTKEILVKNGFVVQKDSFYRQEYTLTVNSDKEEFLFIHLLNYNEGKLLMRVVYSPLTVRKHLDITTEDVYVHILQHALRLCNIKKEIELLII